MSPPGIRPTVFFRFFIFYFLRSPNQFHYDWGLRAVKSVLLVAGKLKRCDPHIDEEAVLMRALRDFNTPKIVSADTPIFLRLIADLFPSMDLAPKVSYVVLAGGHSRRPSPRPQAAQHLTSCANAPVHWHRVRGRLRKICPFGIRSGPGEPRPHKHKELAH